MNKPFKQFIPGLLAITIIKPLIVIAIGEDLITNEDLRETDKLFKVMQHMD